MPTDKRLGQFGYGDISAGNPSDDLYYYRKRTVTINLASVAAATFAEQSVTITGLDADEIVVALYPAAALSVAVGVCYGRISAADTLIVGVVNPSAGALDAASASFTLVTSKSRA